MTRPDLETIEARLKAATAGPWEAYTASCCPDMGGVAGPTHSVMTACVGKFGHPASTEDAEFIAHAREDVPALLAYVKELEARIKQVERTYLGKPGHVSCPWCGETAHVEGLITHIECPAFVREGKLR